MKQYTIERIEKEGMIVFSAIMGYLYIKRESGIVVKPIMKEFKKDNPKLFETKEEN